MVAKKTFQMSTEYKLSANQKNSKQGGESCLIHLKGMLTLEPNNDKDSIVIFFATDHFNSKLQLIRLAHNPKLPPVPPQVPKMPFVN